MESRGHLNESKVIASVEHPVWLEVVFELVAKVLLFFGIFQANDAPNYFGPLRLNHHGQAI